MNSIKIFTIGFTKKTAEEFFGKLKSNNVKKIIDIRLKNTSQLAGFAKADDLRYFLKSINNIKYVHIPEYAPTEQLFEKYMKKQLTWEEYENIFNQLLADRNILNNLNYSELDHACFLCSEPSHRQCHRRLLAEYLQKNKPEIDVVHL